MSDEPITNGNGFNWKADGLRWLLNQGPVTSRQRRKGWGLRDERLARMPIAGDDSV